MTVKKYYHRFRSLSIAVALLGAAAAPAAAELGWTEAQYIKKFGPGTRSPLTPNEAQFNGGGSGRVLVSFKDDRSQEEAFAIDRDSKFVPAALMRQARAVTQGTAARHVEFKLEHAAPAAIFETRAKDIMLQVDVRNGVIARLTHCRGPEPCKLIDRLLKVELATDELLARTQPPRRTGQ